MTRALWIGDPGLLASVQDLGRPGYARVGVSRGGAADRGALRLANRLVGNPESAAAIGITAGGFVATAGPTVLIAVAGALGPVTVGGRAVGTCAPTYLAHGSPLVIGRPTHGLRSYLAVAGGVDTEPILGSRSYSALGGLGMPLAAGSRVPIGPTRVAHPVHDHAPTPAPALRHTHLTGTLGPRAEYVGSPALRALLAATFTVTTDLNRTGIRLDGPPLPVADLAELPSEGMVRGAVQIPPAGCPIIFLSDHPATGGYPVPFVLTEAATDVAAQLVPGMTVRFIG